MFISTVCACCCCFSILLWIVSLFRHIDPYMDEVYHVPQAQRWCRSEFGYWDPKITTFPGTYLISFLVSRLNITDLSCSLFDLRMHIACMAFVLFIALYRCRQILFPHEGHVANLLTAVLLFFYPFSFFYYFLYYTDTAAILLLVLTYTSVQMRKKKQSEGNSNHSKGVLRFADSNSIILLFLSGFCILARQTNAAWIVFMGGELALWRLKLDLKLDRDNKQEGELSFPYLKKLSALFYKRFPELIQLVWPLVIPVVLFLCFVKWNGSIVVGDKEHHKASFSHWAMPLHMLTIAALLFLPTYVCNWLWRYVEYNAKKKPNFNFKLPCSLPVLVCGYIITLLCLQWGSVSHPFLLSDNRHYTFYVWRRLLSKPIIRFMMSPFYFIFAVMIMHKLERTRGAIWLIGFSFIAIVTLVTTPLLEPRYFTPGLTMIILNSSLESQNQGKSKLAGRGELVGICVSIVVCCLVNLAVVYKFVQEPFVWVDGSIARFMY